MNGRSIDTKAKTPIVNTVIRMDFLLSHMTHVRMSKITKETISLARVLGKTTYLRIR